jgi:hypothetical protein
LFLVLNRHAKAETVMKYDDNSLNYHSEMTSLLADMV